jgi:membrane-associated phospholipid phosphatase
MGITNSPSIYNRFVPNPVAAVPSLHATFSILFVLFTFKLFGKKWGALSLIYPFMIFFGVVYMGEHYFFDLVCGTVLAVAAYLGVPYLMKWILPYWIFVKTKVQQISVKLIPKMNWKSTER